jgi:hypothetical protein
MWSCSVQLNTLQNESDLAWLRRRNGLEALLLTIRWLGASGGRGTLSAQDRAGLHRARQLLRVSISAE